MTYIVTSNLGLIAVREETPSVQDWAATYWNWINADKIMYNMISHQHTGNTALANPDIAPTLTTAATGGTLPASTTYFGTVSYIDAFGRETGYSAAGSITTTAKVAAPNTPTHNFQATPADLVATASALTGGNYWYKLTYVKGSGETTASSPVAVVVPTDTTYAATIHFDSLTIAANGADKIFIYRKSGTTGNYVKLIEITATGTASYTDNNTAVVNCDKQPPTTNTTNAFNTVTFDWSALNYTSAEYVKLYITTTGTVGTPTYTASTHLVATVAVSLSTPVTSYEWTGTALTTGKPLVTSQSFPSPPKITLSSDVQGTLPLANLPSPFYRGVYADVASLPTGVDKDIAVVIADAYGANTWYIYDGGLATPAWVRTADSPTPFFRGVYATVGALPSGVDGDVALVEADAYGVNTWYIYGGATPAWVRSSNITNPLYRGVYNAPVDLPTGTDEEMALVVTDGAATPLTIESVYKYNASLATPAWEQFGVQKSGSTVEDVSLSATPTDVELKVNELLAALRLTGIIS